jgi:hypothetical protein
MSMHERKTFAIATLVNSAAIFVFGCSDHPDAGTVDMTAAKKAAAARGFADAKSSNTVKSASAIDRMKGQPPTKASPKGGR